MSRPTILVTNDDGISAKGIRFLSKCMSQIGDVIIVAPETPQSGVGQAITIRKPLRFNKVSLYADIPETYSCSGTPVDCVKIAVNKILKGKPDFCVSGVNHGSNSSVNILYSGTMSAAIEAALEKIPSIGFSYCNHDTEKDFNHISKYVIGITKTFLNKKLPLFTTLNVNFPDREHFKGIKVCRQAIGKWREKYIERKDPNDRPYYWLTGDFDSIEKTEESDEWALENGYISIVPVHTDMTSEKGLELLKTHEWTI